MECKKCRRTKEKVNGLLDFHYGAAKTTSRWERARHLAATEALVRIRDIV